MEQADIDREFTLLERYLDICIQISDQVPKYSWPSFQYYKETLGDPRYSLAIPHYKDAVDAWGNVLHLNHCKGLGIDNGLAYRYFNYWKGGKYYIDSLLGEFTLHPTVINDKFKTL